MQVGVSTACLYPEPLEDALYQLAVNGVGNMEIFINTHSEIKEKFVRELKNILDRFDVGCLSLHPYTCEIEPLMFFSDYDRRLEDALEYYKLYFEAMNILGAKIFVLHGGKADRGKELYCQRYSRLYRLGQEFGVTVAVENVTRCQSRSSAFIREISGMLGSEFAFVLDTKQAVRAGETPFAFLDAAGKSTIHAHISDYGEIGDCLLLGNGSFNFKRFFEKLNSLNPNASVIIELYRSGFSGISELISSYNRLLKMTEQYRNIRAC